MDDIEAADGTPADHALPIDPDLAPDDPGEPAIHRVASAQARTHPTRARPLVLAAIALGGALGAPARYGMARLIPARPGAFPWATFLTNLSGSFALGFLLVLILERFPPTRYLRPFVATGFLGAYTTFSTFMVETDQLVSGGHGATAVAYVLASIAGGLGATWLGLTAGRRMPGRVHERAMGL